jgi:ankyrin repeat protein
MIAPKKSVPNPGRGERKVIEDIIAAATAGDVEKVKTLLQEGANINSADPESGYTCLHIAAAHGDKALLDALLEFDKDHGTLSLSVKTYDPARQAWQLAMVHGHTEIGSLIDPMNTGRKASSRPSPKPGP